MKLATRTAAALLAAVAMTIGGQAQRPTVEALDGTDPVLLLQGKDVLGTPAFKAVHDGFEYLFASADTKAQFEKNPAAYAVQNGGLCARMGRTASGNMSDYAVHDGKIYVFGSDNCRKRFLEAPAKFIAPAAAAMPAGKAARVRAGEVLDRAAAALGGSRLDGMRTFREARKQTLPRMDGEVAATVEVARRFPDAVRAERTMAIADRTMISATLATRDGAWYVADGRAFPLLPAARVNLAAEHERDLVTLLRARRDAATTAASLGTGDVDGVAVERVRVRRGALDVVLGVDPASGRPRTLEFVDRGPDGEFGRFVVRYDDYKAAGGLTLPHAVRATFDSRPEPAQSWTVARIDVDPALDAVLFEPAR